MSTLNSGVRRARQLVSINQVAEYLGCTDRTVRNYIKQGFFPAYRIPRTRGVRLDLSEVDAALKLIPSSRARAGYGDFGPNAHIIDLPAQPVRAEVVSDES